ncbi:DEHA2D05632p [Debaryomyces hansenii CBS767]|uniref:DEHA2D05632p n=1 Tax=Debaryomyces hansenii (strain ATCC 36239 / CBS 767 / BCRC 21394 / JCM 1990 / NBRC 0083 / IGC 2968) TaxID=284592 RepID=Q6BSV8_DEBHA|nr:DEHA2D05632p [Debaryomyces hansenii CBS767]CAG86854.1 DEHA2D05632p [Debaryomyces hansenii CBS767]|eukprot:XP_458712.1 DEHA2D05632p [Debaryomyces hansenii CBS767]
MDFCFFLIGFKEFNKPLKDVGNISCYCGNCHNQSANAIRTINCVTLFFIPVLPFYYSKRLKCTICSASGDLDKATMAKMKEGQPVAIG